MTRKGSLRGTLDLLVLKALSLIKELSGFAIKQRIAMASENVLVVGDSSLYPALKRMKKAGWIVCYLKRTYRRKATIWMLTRKGEKQLSDEVQLWADFASKVDDLLNRQW